MRARGRIIEMEEELLALEKRSESGLSWNYLPLTLERSSLSHTFTTKILPLVRPAWRDCHVQTKVFTEGITNVLLGFYVSREGSRDQEKDDMVLLRMNGAGTDVFLDRRAEILVMLSLHNADLVPPLYLELANGLCYGYIPGRPFTVDDMQDDVMMQRTARAVAHLHAVPVPDTLQSPQPYMWTKIRQFLNTVTGSFTDPHETQRFQEIFGSLAVVSEEVDALQLELRQSESSLVFCHNDLLCGNLIFDSSTGKVSMVDYEYGGPNPAAYDIGNHFCEFAGIGEPVDYERYPSEAVQYKWLRYYLQECAAIRGQGTDSVTDDSVRSLYHEVNRYALAAHLFWTVWSLVQAEMSTIDFDYIEYAGVRFAEYKRRKEQICT